MKMFEFKHPSSGEVWLTEWDPAPLASKVRHVSLRPETADNANPSDQHFSEMSSFSGSISGPKLAPMGEHSGAAVSAPEIEAEEVLV